MYLLLALRIILKNSIIKPNRVSLPDASVIENNQTAAKMQRSTFSRTIFRTIMSCKLQVQIQPHLLSCPLVNNVISIQNPQSLVVVANVHEFHQLLIAPTSIDVIVVIVVPIAVEVAVSVAAAGNSSSIMEQQIREYLAEIFLIRKESLKFSQTIIGWVQGRLGTLDPFCEIFEFKNKLEITNKLN